MQLNDIKFIMQQDKLENVRALEESKSIKMRKHHLNFKVKANNLSNLL